MAQIRLVAFRVEDNEWKSRTLVVDGRLAHLNGVGGRNRRIDPLKLTASSFRDRGEVVLRIRVDIELSGACILTSTPAAAAVHFESLTAALASARATAADAETDIEIWGPDGFYVFVHQPQGWPRRITH